MSAEYYAYLASREWALKREAVRQRSGNRCERCRTAPQQAVHHLTYAHLYDEPLEDLQAICNPCHEYLSGVRLDDPMDPPEPVTVCSVEIVLACSCCSWPVEWGAHFRCRVCWRSVCGGCCYVVGSERRCVDHAEAA